MLFKINQPIRKTSAILPGLLVILLMLITGLCIYRDYGATWDEVSQREIGLVNLSFIRSLDAGIIDRFWDRDHGASFEVLLIWIERLAGRSDTHDIIPLRHLCTFVFYLLGVFCGYLLALRMYRKQWLALTGMVMLLLQPRIFAHAFFNSKDLSFLTAFLIALYAIAAALAGGRKYQYALAGAACGFATGIRTMGGLLIVVVIALLLIKNFSNRVERKAMRSRLLLFLTTGMAVLYITWPSLWYHPIDNLVGSLKSLSQFSRFDTNVLFRGKMIYCTDLPWYYAPYWIAISTPILWLVAGVAGIALFLWHFANKPAAVLRGMQAQMVLICVAVFLLPLLIIIVLRSVVYDDWRHLYFIYPPFVLAGLYGINHISHGRFSKALVLLACCFQSALTVTFMLKAHPFQQVYFNELVAQRPEELRRRFDLDYWGTSYKQGFDYLLAHDGVIRFPSSEFILRSSTTG